jgi:hypothetical protein
MAFGRLAKRAQNLQRRKRYALFLKTGSRTPCHDRRRFSAPVGQRASGDHYRDVFECPRCGERWSRPGPYRGALARLR